MGWLGGCSSIESAPVSPGQPRGALGGPGIHGEFPDARTTPRRSPRMPPEPAGCRKPRRAPGAPRSARKPQVASRRSDPTADDYCCATNKLYPELKVRSAGCVFRLGAQAPPAAAETRVCAAAAGTRVAPPMTEPLRYTREKSHTSRRIFGGDLSGFIRDFQRFYLVLPVRLEHSRIVALQL